MIYRSKMYLWGKEKSNQAPTEQQQKKNLKSHIRPLIKRGAVQYDRPKAISLTTLCISGLLCSLYHSNQYFQQIFSKQT